MGNIAAFTFRIKQLTIEGSCTNLCNNITMAVFIKNVLLEFQLETDQMNDFECKLVAQVENNSDGLKLEKIASYENIQLKKSVYSSNTLDTSMTLAISFIKTLLPNIKVSMSLEIIGNSTTWPQTNAELQLFYESMSHDRSDGHNILPIITRCTSKPISPYFTTSDDRLVEYGIKQVVFDKKSEYQRVQIISTYDHGNVLILDGAMNLAENDTKSYTHALMNIPQDLHLYSHANVLILGGGDGGLIKEILSLSSKVNKLILVDLDEIVMEACSKHMRSVCGHYLDKDKRNGDNYNVIVGDAVKYMEEKKALGDEFDIIFGDLTDVPVEPEAIAPCSHSVFSPHQEAWIFIEKILNLALDILKPVTGKYYTHCNGKSVPAILEKYESLLGQIVVPKKEGKYRLKWTRTESFVPSFMEVWVFYQILLVPF